MSEELLDIVGVFCFVIFHCGFPIARVLSTYSSGLQLPVTHQPSTFDAQMSKVSGFIMLSLLSLVLCGIIIARQLTLRVPTSANGNKERLQNVSCGVRWRI